MTQGLERRKKKKKNRREKIKKYIWQNYKGNLTKKEIEKNGRKEIEKEKERNIKKKLGVIA